ncbi:MAG: hypothetical protein FWD69_09340 [Polyangiaceae bacterium]|nr:hypothetical protein [Polyangiaceae bacterium]
MNTDRQCPHELDAAKHRAQARRASAGAVMFVVVTTLGLLAVMAVYAMSTTTSDIRAASNFRRALQAQHAAEFAAVAAADYVTSANADNIVNVQMLNPPPPTDTNAAQNNCLSAQKNLAGVTGSARAKSCVRITPNDLKLSWGGNKDMFTSQSFGNGTLSANGDPTLGGDFIIELTNPTQAPPPPGYDVNLRLKFAMLSVSTYGLVRVGGTTAAPGTYVGDSMQVGRGRFIVGPLNQ